MKMFYDEKLKALSTIAFLAGTMALVLSLSRSATVAVVVVFIIYAWTEPGHKYAPILLISSLTTCAAAIPFIPEIYWERLWTLFDFGTDRTLFRRISYNLIGLQLWFQHPIIGVGPGNFPEYYISQEFRWYPGRVPVPRQLHNSYLELAAETGTIGLALFMGIMVSALRRVISVLRFGNKAFRARGYQLSYAFGAYMIASIFMPNEDTKYFWLLPAVCIACFLRAKSDGQLLKRPS
jgi:O-antigen ligase